MRSLSLLAGPRKGVLTTHLLSLGSISARGPLKEDLGEVPSLAVAGTRGVVWDPRCMGGGLFFCYSLGEGRSWGSPIICVVPSSSWGGVSPPSMVFGVPSCPGPEGEVPLVFGITFSHPESWGIVG